MAEGYDTSNKQLADLLWFIPLLNISLEDEKWNKLSADEKNKALKLLQETEEKAKQNANHSYSGTSNFSTNYNANNSNEYTTRKIDNYIQNLDSFETRKETQIENNIEQIKENIDVEKEEITEEKLYKKIEEEVKAKQDIIKQRKSLVKKTAKQ